MSAESLSNTRGKRRDELIELGVDSGFAGSDSDGMHISRKECLPGTIGSPDYPVALLWFERAGCGLCEIVR